MAADPHELTDEAGFAIVRRGYDQAQVDAHMRRLDAEIKILHTDRAAAVAQTDGMQRELEAARARAERLRAHLQNLTAQPSTVQHMSERMRSMLRLAEDEVAEMLTAAQTQADKRIAEAELAAREIIDAARVDAEGLRAATRSDLDEAIAGHHRARAELAEEQRSAAAAHEATTSAIDTDREQMLAEIAQLRATAQDESAELRRAAETEAAAVRGAAATEAARIRTEAAAEQERLQSELAERRRAAEAAIVAADADAEARRASAWADSEYRRAMVEEDFTIAMDQRRKEAIAALGTQLTDARREAAELRAIAAAEIEQTLAAAREQAAAIVADTQRSVEELTELRQRIVAQLGGVRSEIDRSIGRLGGQPEERNGAASAFPTPSSSPERADQEHPAEEHRPSPTRRTLRPQPAHH